MKNIIENLSAQIALKISEKFLEIIKNNFETLFENRVFDIVKVNIQPGDIVILRHPRILRQDAHKRLQEAAQPHFPNNKILVFEDGLDISVVSTETNSNK